MTINLIPENWQQRLFEIDFPKPPKSVVNTLNQSDVKDESSWVEKSTVSLHDEPGCDVEEWFNGVADDLASDFKYRINKLFDTMPSPFPDEIPEIRDSWNFYDGEQWVEISENELPYWMVLDAETVKDRGIWYPITMVAWSSTGWYCWIANPTPHGDSRSRTVPFPNGRLVAGWSVQYDRQFLSSEYLGFDSGNRFLDGMSMATAIWGLNGQQTAAYRKFEQVKDHKPVPEWFNHATEVSLDAVYKFLFGRRLSKGVRDEIISSNWGQWNSFATKIVKYCGSDVKATHKCIARIYAKFTSQFLAHNASLVGMLEIGSSYLPLDEDWFGYQQRSEAAYEKSERAIKDLIDQCAQEILYRGEENCEIEGLEWRQMKGGKWKNYVKWYADLAKADFPISGRLAPQLLKLRWKGEPIYFEKNGNSGTWRSASERMPHPQGVGKNLGSPLIPDYRQFVVNEQLTTAWDHIDLKDLFETLDSLTNWRSMRERVDSVNVMRDNKGNLCTIPQIKSMGTQSRRAADNTWLVAPNAKGTKIGSEIKSMVAAPPGYKIVGADVDSEELWLASVLGDWLHEYPGSNIWSKSVLVGDKNKETSLHCITAAMTGLPRTVAKNLNFGIQYGSGVKKCADTIQSKNPEKSRVECEQLADRMISSTKGKRSSGYNPETNQKEIKSTYQGGIGSNVFNVLDDFSERPDVRTSVLGFKIPDSLNPKYVMSDFKTTRVNWLIQSAGVDFLHLLLTGIRYYTLRLKLDVRLVFPIHDEVRYMVADKDVDEFVKVLQTVHIKAKAYTYYVNGIQSMPQAVAWFGDVDVDDRLRKEVDDQCQTPSTPEGFEVVGYKA